MTSPEQPALLQRRRRWPRVLVFVTVLLLLALLIYGLIANAPDERIDQSLADGETPSAPGFGLALLERGDLPGPLAGPVDAASADGQVELGELAGVPMVLNFWASWCVPCREEAPVLQRGWERAGSRGILYLGLDMQDLTDDAIEFMDEFGLTYPSVRDPGRDVADDYGATGIPETYFIDVRGRVVGHVVGVVSEVQLEEGARAAKAGELVGAIDGGAIRPQR